MNLECLNDIITKRLAIHIDVSDNQSWNGNTAYTSVSLNKWNYAKSEDISLLDFGLTAYDIGRADNLYDTSLINGNNLNVTLHRIGYNNFSGQTMYDLYPIEDITTGSTVGNYFDLNGGYLQGFFKLQGYEYELLPPRFGEGITIENIIKIDPNSSGIFFYMGARSEDKYNDFFSGETKKTIRREVEVVRTGIVNRTGRQVREFVEFSGVTTSIGTNLNAYINEDVQRQAFSDFSKRSDIRAIEQPKDSINDNVISLEITSDKKILFKKVNSNGLIDQKISPNSINVGPSGWTIITMTFTPYIIIGDREELKCADRRKGDLTVYVNGRRFWKISNFDEFFFKNIKNTKEKVIGVPYNISWGGGSFGLKHSWHYDIRDEFLYSGETQNFIDDNFIQAENPLNDEKCPSLDNNFGVLIFEENNEFGLINECDSTIVTPITTLSVGYSGTTAQTPANQYFFEYVNFIELLSNRDYVISASIMDTGIFNYFAKGSISLVIYGSEDVIIIDEKIYETNLRKENEFVDIFSKIKITENSGLQNFKVGILIESNLPLNESFELIVKNIKLRGSDILSQDSRKSNLTVEKNFNNSFIGGIQKLRIYDISFNSQEVLHNARIESIKNPGYGLSIVKGGRIINK